jgi:hypothetical protein
MLRRSPAQAVAVAIVHMQARVPELRYLLSGNSPDCRLSPHVLKEYALGIVSAAQCKSQQNVSDLVVRIQP